MRKVLNQFTDRLRGMFADDESGAESSEVILVLVLLVVGLMAMWKVLKDKLNAKGQQTADCIENASGTATC